MSTDEQNARENMRDTFGMDRSPGESEKASLERRAVVWALLAIATELHAIDASLKAIFGLMEEHR
jgi:hypothetical protein